MYRFTSEGLEALESSTAQVVALKKAQDEAGLLAKPRHHYLYELKGVIVHSGSASAGHYYSFVKERPKLTLKKNGSQEQVMWEDRSSGMSHSSLVLPSLASREFKLGMI
jgi:ubiquitin C-terminal hydrolase